MKTASAYTTEILALLKELEQWYMVSSGLWFCGPQAADMIRQAPQEIVRLSQLIDLTLNQLKSSGLGQAETLTESLAQRYLAVSTLGNLWPKMYELSEPIAPDYYKWRDWIKRHRSPDNRFSRMRTRTRTKEENP